MKDKVLLIMAAGLGSRFGGLKQLEPIGPNGEFIIDYSIYDAIKCGFTKVVLVIKEENYDLFRESIGVRIEKHIKVEYVFQDINNVPINHKLINGRTKPLGTVHVVYSCKDIISDNFGVINADDFYGRDAFVCLHEFLENKCNITNYGIVAYEAGNTLSETGSVKRAVINMDKDHMTSLVESSIIKKGDFLESTSLLSSEVSLINNDRLVSMNMFAFHSSFVEKTVIEMIDFMDESKYIETSEGLISDFVSKLVNTNQLNVEVAKTSAKWFGVTYKEDTDYVKSSINNLIESGVYPEKLWSESDKKSF